MELLIVHDDAEVGEQLAGMVADYTAHDCNLVENQAAALHWAETHARCHLLLAQLDGRAVDGLTLGGSLSEVFAGLHILFLPAYAAAEQRLEIARPKVFPEPIDGEALLDAIERAAAVPPGAPDLFHVLDILQMCCLSKRSGAVQLVKEGESGIVFLKEGRIVHAEGASTRGREALVEIAGWEEIEFAYDAEARGPETISTPWGEALLEAVARRKEKADEVAPAPPASEPPPEIVAAPPPKRRGFFAGLRWS